jgi:DNA (cytosine-5)-methyltransferase 1
VTDPGKVTSNPGKKVILSIFPGIDLLGRAFEEEGFCIVRGPDLLWGGDIRRFTPPPDVFWGVIGGSPCQDFSGLRRSEPTGYGQEMLDQFARCVTNARPEWWLLENVARVPDCDIAGYVTQRLDINNGWYGEATRLRHIQFGSLSGRLLDVTRRRVTGTEPVVLANDSRSFRQVCRLQGLPEDFDLPGFTVVEKIKAVGNGVPIPMGRILARAIKSVYGKYVAVQVTLDGNLVKIRACACGCGRTVTGKARYYDYSCRKRAQRERDRSASQPSRSRNGSA